MTGKVVLGFDPGEEHTGWALVNDGILVKSGVLKRWRQADMLILRAGPDVVVAEDFLLYPSKARAQSGDRIWTARVLGVVQYICERYGITFKLQPAVRIRHDPLVKDLKIPGSKHSTDAYKHAMVYHFTNYTDVYRAKNTT